MSAQKHLLKKAISLYQTGDCETSRLVLLGVLQNDPTNQEAWIRFGEIFPSLGGRLATYKRALDDHPQMDQVRQVYDQLRQEPPIIPVTPAAVGTQRLYGTAQPGPAVRPAPKVAARPATPAPKQSRPTWTLLTLLVIFTLLAGMTVTSLVFNEQTMAEKQKVAELSENIRRLQNDLNLNRATLKQLQQDYQKLAADNSTVSAENTNLKKQSEELSLKFNALTQEYSTVSAEYQKLQGDHQALTDQYNTLSTDHQTLQGQYQTLKGDYETLGSSFNALSAQYQDLQSRYATLDQNFASFRKNAVVPPYITVRDRNINMVFYKTDHSVANWSLPFSKLEKDIERGYDSRKSWTSIFTPRLTLRTDSGEEYQVVDFRPYVDSSNFGPYVSDLYRQAETDEDFIREVWNTVTQLAPYTSDNGIETPRYPLETLLAGGGDCEDTAILFASMIKATPAPWKVYLVYMNSNFPKDVMKPNHVMVKISTGAKDYLVETTSNTNMLPYSQGAMGWYMEVQ